MQLRNCAVPLRLQLQQHQRRPYQLPQRHRAPNLSHHRQLQPQLASVAMAVSTVPKCTRARRRSTFSPTALAPRWTEITMGFPVSSSGAPAKAIVLRCKESAA